MLKINMNNNISLNSEKIQFKQEHINFYGYTLTDEGIQPNEDKLQAIKTITSSPKCS